MKCMDSIDCVYRLICTKFIKIARFQYEGANSINFTNLLESIVFKILFENKRGIDMNK